MVDLLTYVIFSSICEFQGSFSLKEQFSFFLLHGEEKCCQNRNQHGGLAHLRDFHVNLTKDNFPHRGEPFSSKESRKKFSSVFRAVQHMPDRLRKDSS